MPPRIIEPGTVTGASGTPSTHSQLSTGTRPGSTLATTRSPQVCAYADTQIAPSGPVATSE